MAIDHIENLEAAASVRAKLNAVIDAVNTGGGGASLDLTTTAHEAISAGQAVYIRADNQAALAAQTNYATAAVVGIAKADALPGAAVTIQIGGTATLAGLVAGLPHYLHPSVAGALTPSAPTAAGLFVTRVGLAVRADALSLSVQPPVLL
jgi:hypothetical protein